MNDSIFPHRFLALTVSWLALGGCMLTPTQRAENEAATQVNADLRQLVVDQQQLIAQQSERLEILEENQWILLDSMNGVESQLQVLSTQKTAPPRPSKRKTSNAGVKVQEDTVKAAQQDLSKIVLGRVEWAWLDLAKKHVKARVDTGATSSSVSALNIKKFERDGKDWVRFELPDAETQKKYELPLIKYVRIKQANSEEERRPVVKMKVQVGEIVDESEFTLTNRENMLYPVLLGRSFLKDIAIVDVSRRFTQKKRTPSKAK